MKIQELIAKIRRLELIIKDLEKRLDDANDNLHAAGSIIAELEAQFGVTRSTDF